MPKTMQENAVLAPLDLSNAPGLKEKIVRAAKIERLSVAEWSRRVLAEKVGYKLMRKDR